MRKTLGAVALTLALIATACGADATVAITDSDDQSSGVLSEALEAASPETAVEATPTEAPAEPTATPVPEPTTPPAAEPVTFDVQELPALLADLDLAVGNSAVSPSEMAQRLIGFPYDIPTTPDASLLSLTGRLSFVFEGQAGWEYEMRTLAGAPVGDVDINAEEYGPGSVEVTEFYDPVMEGLGFSRTGSTASDPGDEGGPNSVNHVYPPNERVQVINGIPGEVPNVKIWLAEDMLGAAYNDDYDLLPGYRYEFDFDTAENAGVPVPVLAAILDELPVPAEARLVGADVRLRTRDTDSFSADLGLNFIDTEFEWELPEGTDFDELMAFYGDASNFTNQDVLIAGEEGFGQTDGQIVPSELSEYSNGERFQLLTLMLQRWTGLFELNRADEDRPVRVTFRMDLNPNDVILQN